MGEGSDADLEGGTTRRTPGGDWCVTSREGGTKNKTPGGATIQLELGQHSRGDG